MARGMLNIRSDEFVVLANKLQRIGKADLPVAVRSTLNQLAFDMKGTSGKRGEIDKRAEMDFDYRRNKTLFKAITGVTKADGLNISNMESEAGIIKRSGMDEIAEGLADQQKGGTTKQKATPLSRSRTGRNIGKKVRKPAYLQNLDSIDLTGKKKQKFVTAAIRAAQKRRTVLIEGRGGTKLIARIRAFKRVDNSVDFRMDWLYRINANGNVSLKRKRPFVDRAADEVIKTLPQEFVRQAEKRITKAFQK